jgi:hypothetical protein
MTFEEWAAGVPECLKRDPLWRFEVYRKALLLYDLAWQNCARLMKDPRGRSVCGQLLESAGSVSANICALANLI